MKNLLKKLTILSLLVVMAISLVGCFGIPNDIKDVKGNLRDADYEVEVVENLDEANLEDAFLTALLVYVNSDGKKDLEKKYADLANDLKDVKHADFEALIAFDDVDVADNVVFILFFEEKSAANEVYSLTKDFLQSIKDEGFDKDYIDCKRDDITFGKNGNVIYFGTKDAVKAAK